MSSTSWDVKKKIDDYTYILNNDYNTIVRMSRRIKPEVVASTIEMMRMKKVPINFTEGLDEIYFTYLNNKTAGYYENFKITLSCSKNALDMIPETLTHELGHFVDAVELIYKSSDIRTEKKHKAKKLEDSYAMKNISEYIAVGFEMFYFSDKRTKKLMRKNNPNLYSIILKTHKKYNTL